MKTNRPISQISIDKAQVLITQAAVRALLIRRSIALTTVRLRLGLQSVLNAWLVIVLVVLPQVATAQAPEVQWRRTDWAPMHPVNGYQTQDASGEDWWYDHKNSYSGNLLNGYICAGYSTFRNWTINESNGGCLSIALGNPDCKSFETAGNLVGRNLATMGLVTPDGTDLIWFKTFNEGWFYRVIQTYDGGYVAVGVTASTRRPDNNSPLFYNPNQKAGAVTDQFNVGSACTAGSYSRHVSLVKTDSNGNLQWQYIYGMHPFRDDSGIPHPDQAYLNQAVGWDVIETPDGHFRIVGNAWDSHYSYFCTETKTLQRAFMIEVDSNGYWLWGNFYGPTDYPSNGAAITKYYVGGNLKYVMSGTEFFQGSTFNNYIGCYFYRKAYVMQFNDSPSPVAPEWERNSFSPNTSASQSNYDVQINANGEILLPVTVDCTNCLYSGYNTGQARVYRLDNSGYTLGACDLGQVTAFDLKLRVSPTTDGGFGVVSTKQVYPPPASYYCTTYDGHQDKIDTSYWNTDAYVAKCNACDNIEWETTFNVDNAPPAPYPSDQKKQECMYSISQGDDGGFVIAGNNSYNSDDNYLVKLGPPPTLIPDINMRDTPQDVGLEPNPDKGPMWVSNDIWIRPDSTSGFSDDAHVNPEYGQVNYVFVRIRNKGCQSASGTLKVYWSKASTGLSWPAAWNNYVPTVPGCPSGILYGDQIRDTSGVPIDVPVTVPSHGELRVAIPWRPPNPSDFICSGTPEPGHFCLLARIETASGMTYAEGSDIYANVNNNNKIVWKNVEVVDQVEEGPSWPVIIKNVSSSAMQTRLSFEVPEFNCQYSFFQYGAIDVDLGKALSNKWKIGGEIGRGIDRISKTAIRVSKPNAWIGNIQLDPNETRIIKVQFHLFRKPTASEMDGFNLDVVQYATNHNKAVGGVRFTAATKYADPRSRLDVLTRRFDPATDEASAVSACTATVEGVVFNDVNGDGVQNPDLKSGEVGLEGRMVVVKEGDRKVWTEMTDAQGNYSFDLPSPGTYTISQVQEEGWEQTFPLGQTDHRVRVRAGQRVDNFDFGNYSGLNFQEFKLGKEGSGPSIWHSRFFTEWAVNKRLLHH